MPSAKQTHNETPATADAIRDGLSVLGNLCHATQSYLAGMYRYSTDFFIPYLLSTHYFQRVEGERLLKAPPADSFEAYLGLMGNNIELMDRSLNGTAKMIMAYAQLALDDFSEA